MTEVCVARLRRAFGIVCLTTVAVVFVGTALGTLAIDGMGKFHLQWGGNSVRRIEVEPLSEDIAGTALHGLGVLALVTLTSWIVWRNIREHRAEQRKGASTATGEAPVDLTSYPSEPAPEVSLRASEGRE
jgi:hypothetical protein